MTGKSLNFLGRPAKASIYLETHLSSLDRSENDYCCSQFSPLHWKRRFIYVFIRLLRSCTWVMFKNVKSLPCIWPWLPISPDCLDIIDCDFSPGYGHWLRPAALRHIFHFADTVTETESCAVPSSQPQAKPLEMTYRTTLTLPCQFWLSEALNDLYISVYVLLALTLLIGSVIAYL